MFAIGMIKERDLQNQCVMLKDPLSAIEGNLGTIDRYFGCGGTNYFTFKRLRFTMYT